MMGCSIVLKNPAKNCLEERDITHKDIKKLKVKISERHTWQVLAKGKLGGMLAPKWVLRPNGSKRTQNILRKIELTKKI